MIVKSENKETVKSNSPIVRFPKMITYYDSKLFHPRIATVVRWWARGPGLQPRLGHGTVTVRHTVLLVVYMEMDITVREINQIKQNILAVESKDAV